MGAPMFSPWRLLCALLLSSSHALAATGGAPCNPKALVQAGSARFCVLTPHVIRMEYSRHKSFRDDRTMIIQRRDLEVPPFTVHQSKENGTEVFTIKTSHVELMYRVSAASFSDDNLSVRLVNTSAFPDGMKTWKPSQTDKIRQDALPGTIRTLDTVRGQANLDCLTMDAKHVRNLHCTYGIISKKHGFVVVDDAQSASLDEDPQWSWLKPAIDRTSDQSVETCSGITPENARVCGMEIMSKGHCEQMGCCFIESDELSEAKKGFNCFYGSQSYQDLYFFGHGLDFKAALRDFTTLSGPIPIPPRFAMGVFYSRWWAYSDKDFQHQIIEQYMKHGLPLDVVVMDMDWHITFYKSGRPDQAGQRKGWTGYTWNKELFPNPQEFLNWIHNQGLHITLNLHPASGVQPWEDTYEAVARAMGVDPKTKQYIPFRPADKKYMEVWLNTSIGAREHEGVDFWWLDWQQGEDWIANTSNRVDVNPTLWLNHVFSTNPNHWTEDRRHLILHRFGGLGSHRYPVGFSGDVIVSWESLKYQPYFTAMAANVGFSYWSHDLGGFEGASAPELFTRWLQWGAFSPIFRTHSSKQSFSDRRIWKYGDDYYEITRDAMLLRASMIPYIYTEAKFLTYNQGLGYVRGMFIEWPHLQESYMYRQQYMFGRSIFVSPVVEPADSQTKMAFKSIWIPEGKWFDMTLGKLLSGPAIYNTSYSLSEIPWFVRAGSIIPRALHPPGTILTGEAMKIPRALHLEVSPGADEGTYEIYEDDGKTNAYMKGIGATTKFEFSRSPQSLSFSVSASSGNLSSLPSTRSYKVEFIGELPPKSVEVDGVKINTIQFSEEKPVTCNDYDYFYHAPDRLSLVVCLGKKRAVTESTSIRILIQEIRQNTRESNALDIVRSGLSGKFSRLQLVKTLLDNQWGVDTVFMDDYVDLMNAYGAERRILYNPENAVEEINAFDAVYEKAIGNLHQLHGLKDDIRAQAIALLSSIHNPRSMITVESAVE